VVVRIREAILADAEAIATVHVRSWQAVYRGQLPDEYLDGLSVDERLPQHRWALEHPRPDWRVWVADEERSVVGFAVTGPSEDADAGPGTAELYAIYLDPGVYGTGVGRRLFTHAIEDLRERGFGAATLWVLESNDRARRFYDQAGWKLEGATTTERIDCLNYPTVRYRSDLA
jgi:ribosomal protein S18 acetylase RimI-like enzyme